MKDKTARKYLSILINELYLDKKIDEKVWKKALEDLN